MLKTVSTPSATFPQVSPRVADNGGMYAPQRSPWWGLTGSQLTRLDEDLRKPWRAHLKDPERHADVAVEYAQQGMALLAANDVRGALYFADLYQYARARADRLERPREAERDTMSRAPISARLSVAADPDRRKKARAQRGVTREG